MSLNNYFLSKKQKEQKQKEEQEYTQLASQQRSRSVKNLQYSSKMLQRLENFTDNRFSNDYLSSMKYGSIPSLHPSHHQFRDRKKESELSSTGGITLKTFSVAKIRAETAQSEFRSAHLDTGVFDPNLPNKSHKHWLKVDDKSRETQPMRFGVRQRSENERLQRVQAQQHSQLDYTGTDQKMIHFPEWKSDQKSEWMDSKNMGTNPCHYQGFQSNPPWAQFPVQLDQEDHTYVDGYEVVGDLSRKRLKEQEGNRTDFQATIKNDVLASNINYSQSLRTMMQDKVLNVKQDHDKFSSKIAFYKSALIKTKSIDHTVPYHHSNNYKGLTLKDLRPATQGKLFINSITHYNQPLLANARRIPIKESSPPRSLHQPHQDMEFNSFQQSHLAKIHENNMLDSIKPGSHSIRASKILPNRPVSQFHKVDDVQAKKLVEKYFR